MAIDPSIALQVRTPQMPDPLESYAKLLQIQHAKAMQPLQEQAASIQNQDQLAQVAERQQQVQLRGQAAKSQQVVDSLMSNSMVQDPTTGAWTLDRPKFEAALAQGGNGHYLPQLSESLDKMDESTRKASSARRQTIADALIAVHKAGNTAGALQTGVALLQKNNLIDASHAQPLLDAVDQGASPDQIGQMLQHIGQGMPEYQAALDREEKRKTDLVKEKSAQAKSDAETAKMAAETGNLQKYGQATAPTLQQKDVLLDGVPTIANYDPKSGKLLVGGQDVSARAKPVPPASVQYPKPDDEAIVLTPEGLDSAATRYHKDGTLPPMGMGKQGAAVRSKILNRAAALYPADDIAANKADYTANRGALTQLQKQRDAIGAFEQTAGKNIDIFLKEAGKVVDTGSPMMNTVARMVSGKMLGSSDQAGYDAARQVAINEIAKITSNPNLSGSLSDSARHEVDAFNPREATLKQTVEVMRILKQDMKNRTAAMDEQLKTIRGRISGKSGSADTATAPAASSGTFSYQDYLKAKGGK